MTTPLAHSLSLWQDDLDFWAPASLASHLKQKRASLKVRGPAASACWARLEEAPGGPVELGGFVAAVASGDEAVRDEEADGGPRYLHDHSIVDHLVG